MILEHELSAQFKLEVTKASVQILQNTGHAGDPEASSYRPLQQGVSRAGPEAGKDPSGVDTRDQADLDESIDAEFQRCQKQVSDCHVRVR